MKKKHVLKGLEPQNVFYYFEEIARIPHGSGNEKALSDYIVNRAREQGYEVNQDAAYNVAVEIPASPGYENRKKTIIQAHMDMVCSKTEDSLHDFEKEPLELYIDGEFIRANKTTLGADDGSGVAIMLALMEEGTFRHPPMQLLFTTGEEILFAGAKAMDEHFLNGEQLIGLDCSSGQTIVVSCAGISISQIAVPLEKYPLKKGNEKSWFHIDIRGLLSGHSGNKIHTGRASGIKLLGEVLASLDERLEYELLKTNSQGLINIISKAADADICCEAEGEEEKERIIQALLKRIEASYRAIEPNLTLTVEKRSQVPFHEAYCTHTKKTLLNLLEFLPYGVRTMMPSMDMAESSMNCGYLLEKEDLLELGLSVRSNSEYQHDHLLRQLRHLSDMAGGTFTMENRCAAWEYDPESLLQKKAKAIYERLNGEAPEMKTLHASVEAGVFVEKMKKRGKTLDIINIGCDQYDVHTVSERLNISSVAKLYRLLTTILEETDEASQQHPREEEK